MTKPAVLYIGPLPPHPGGSATVGAMVVNGLHRLGHDIVAISPASTSHGRHELSRFVPGITVHAVPIHQHRDGHHPVPRAQIDTEGRRMLEIGHRLVAAWRPDVVLVGRGEFELPALGIANRLDIPIVMIDHGMSSHHYDGYHRVPEVFRSLGLLEKAQCVIAVAEQRAAILRDNGWSHVVAIPNAADTALFRPGPADQPFLDTLGVPRGARLTAHVSKMSPVKRIGDFLRALARIADTDTTLHALVVGDGPDRAALEAETTALGLGRRVTFTGWLERESLVALYRSIDLLVHPSEIEVAPLVVLEAIASACPVVASDIRAHREMVRHGETGVLVPVGDINSLARSILQLMNAPERRRSIATAAHTELIRRSAETMIARYSAVLTTVVKRAPMSERHPGDWSNADRSHV